MVFSFHLKAKAILIENITKDKVIKLGLYTRLTEEQLNKLETPDGKVEPILTDSMTTQPASPNNDKNNSDEPDYSNTVRNINFSGEV